jgi:undecaprenyl-diphosphatase
MLESITDWILSLSGWLAVTIVFLGPALESSTFVGLVWPGEIAVILGGVLAYRGQVSLGAVIAAAILGAIAGDTIGYWIGRRWGERMFLTVGRRVPIIRHRIDEHLANATAFIARRGGWAIVLGRFTSALRVMVPALAGTADMGYRTFLTFNALGSILWGLAFVLIGFFSGAAWERASRYAGWAGLALLGTIVLGYVLYRLVRARREASVP